MVGSQFATSQRDVDEVSTCADSAGMTLAEEHGLRSAPRVTIWRGDLSRQEDGIGWTVGAC